MVRRTRIETFCSRWRWPDGMRHPMCCSMLAHASSFSGSRLQIFGVA